MRSYEPRYSCKRCIARNHDEGHVQQFGAWSGRPITSEPMPRPESSFFLDCPKLALLTTITATLLLSPLRCLHLSLWKRLHLVISFQSTTTMFRTALRTSARAAGAASSSSRVSAVRFTSSASTMELQWLSMPAAMASMASLHPI
jgi:hypothetical protein